ncbi:DNA-binding protein [Embleya hyalina]|uniref:DNA-binding protein n=1 Tax=Embleya hyalina TaxID=516124 RepID=A0A401YQB7_9ACTN|nr:DNA-binding protein [Embleya hyalina]
MGILAGVDPSTALREFLVSRRARLSPRDVGLSDDGPRRVVGLRREEVASLAAVSVDHYIRLERGQASRVSDAVLDAVAEALRLTRGERQYLRNLARPGAATARERAAVRPGLRVLLDAWGPPAYVVGRNGVIVAWNRAATRVFLDFGEVPPERRSIGGLMFGDPRAKALYADWERKAGETVAYLRTEVGKRPRDPDLAVHLRELAAISPDFVRLWSAQAKFDLAHGTCRIRHPLVGALDLTYESLHPSDDPDKVVIAYAPADAVTAAALALLDGES